MFTIRGPIEKSPEVKEESRKLFKQYIDFMCHCKPEEEMEIGEYIHLHGSKAYNDWWNEHLRWKEENQRHGIIVN